MGASREVPDSAWGGQETPVGASHQEDILADNSGKGSEEGTGFQQRPSMCKGPEVGIGDG